MDLPLVTAVMITGKSVSRYPLALRAVTSFLSQTYPNRQLLIINDGPPLLPLNFNRDMVHECLLLPSNQSLGELRNTAIEAALAQPKPPDYFVQWDDDDFSHHTRISIQFSLIGNAAACLLRHEIHSHLQRRISFVNDGKNTKVGGFAGTMMWRADCPTRFPTIGRREDTEFLLRIKKAGGRVQVIDNDPRLYLRFYHGHNTWDEKHVMRRQQNARELHPSEQQWVDTIYDQHYEELRVKAASG